MTYFAAGTKVEGEYHGKTFHGTVSFMRPHTLNNSVLHFIDLDSKITVYGTERDSIVFSTNEPKGDPKDWIRAA